VNGDAASRGARPAPTAGSDLVVVANRGPASFQLGEDDELVVHHAAGGLAPSLLRALSGTNALWIASAMTEGDRRAAGEGVGADLGGGIDLHLVDLPREVRDAAYRVIANGTLWFLLHNMFDLTRRPLFDRRWHEAWEGYRAFNRAIAEEVASAANDGATVVVNDYHLFLAGAHLAELRPDLKTVHFTHTPFCGPDELRTLPRSIAVELLSSMASFGACGFHTRVWADRFRAGATALLGEAPRTFVSALGTDADELRAIAASPACGERREALEERLAGRRLVLRSDRVEPSKNLLRGFLAFEELLERGPRWRREAVFLARTYPSRQELPEYLAYRSEVEHLVARVNERFASGGRPPVELEVADDFEASVAALSRYDVLLVNPIRDGMNLVAKEGPVVNSRDGVLALSHDAGAFEELGAHALEVEPFDVHGTAAALERALEMPASERAERSRALVALAASRPPRLWFDELVAAARRPVARRGG